MTPVILAAAIALASPVADEACGRVVTSWYVDGISVATREAMERYRQAWRRWCERRGSIAPIVREAIEIEATLNALDADQIPPVSGDDPEAGFDPGRPLAAHLPLFLSAGADGPLVEADWFGFTVLAREGTAEDRDFLADWALLGRGSPWAGAPPNTDNFGGCLALGERDLTADYLRARARRDRSRQAPYAGLLDGLLRRARESLAEAADGRFPLCRRKPRAAADLDRLARAAARRDPALAAEARRLAAAVRAGTTTWSDPPEGFE